ncbi:hypothetical protein [Cryobacterium sp. PH29-G1]|uniref:hypothetical protein n=1 Tax=Cryobacterium sp. PH29-G1 TaxID=3046211 RepID=UPI0024BAC19E|nr:hypothetical protein [Cryobacterium sp. PH29-G1]MDJ0350347.1 hypothetical protein [Cryobacterium sp. PH29-G1]
MSSTEQPQDPSADNVAAGETSSHANSEIVQAAATVTVHRAPRYRNFMLLGAILGVLLAFVFTLAFPANDEYGRLQIFGFLLLGGIAVGAGFGAVVALVIDQITGRSRKTAVADRLGVNDPRAAEPGSGTPNDDFHTFNEK